MKKNRMIKRILYMVLTLIVGISMTGMSVYAVGDVGISEGVNAAGDTVTQNEDVSGEEGISVAGTETLNIDPEYKDGKTYAKISWTYPGDLKVVIDGGDQITVLEGTSPYEIELGDAALHTVYAESLEGPNVTKKILAMKVTASTSSANNATATVSWTGVKNQTVSNYEVSATGLTSQNTTETSCTFTGLTPRTPYKFKVTATVGGKTYESGESNTVVAETVTRLKALKDYNGVTLTWKPLTGEGVTGYNIYRNGALVKNISGMTASTAYVNGTAAGTTYNYQIAPVYTGDVEGTKSTAAPGTSVRQAFVYVSMKTKRKLKAHDGSGAKVTVYKNERIKSYGFTAGKYIFDKNGHKFYVNRTSTKKASYDYTNSWDYSTTEAANFVNHMGISSSTSRLIWVSFYTQQIYLFSGSAGKWTCYDTWKISTGKASSPSPTGKKSIGKKISKRHKLSYWSCFSSLNAFHGVNASSWKKGLGKPKSGGCIRNLTSQAKQIYKTIPKNTRVYCY